MTKENQDKNVTSNSIECFRTVRAERRANDLTVEAIMREIVNSASSTVSVLLSAVIGWYVAYDKRQQRRRHHYRRAVNAASAERLPAQPEQAPALAAVTSPALPVVASPALANGPFIHIVGGEAESLRNAVAAVKQMALAELPPAYVCAVARRGDARNAAS